MKRVLLPLLFISVAAIVLTQFVLNHWTELFAGGAKIGDIVYNLSLDYIASYIFYVLVVYWPEQRNKKNIYPYIIVQTDKISVRSQQVFNELERRWGHHLDSNKVTEDDLKRMLACTRIYDLVSVVSPTPQGDVQQLTFFQYLGVVVREIKEAEEKILMHPTIVDSGIISRVRSITSSTLFTQIEQLSALNLTNSNLCFLSQDIFHWLHLCTELKVYVDKETGPYLNK